MALDISIPGFSLPPSTTLSSMMAVPSAKSPFLFILLYSFLDIKVFKLIITPSRGSPAEESSFSRGGSSPLITSAEIVDSNISLKSYPAKV